MNDLREDLDRALRDVVPGVAPVAEAIRRGKAIRVRRRAAVVASAVAVVAVAAASPVLARHAAAPAARPAQHRNVPASHHDPVVTAGPAGTTMGPGGLVAHGGVIAEGRIGARTWRTDMRLESGMRCFLATVSAGGSAAASVSDNCPTLPPPGRDPAVFATCDAGTTVAALGRVAADVTYLIATFSDGQQLKLIPVAWHGTRYVAWVAPESMTISSVVAHLGGPYFDSGQRATVPPTSLPGQR